MNVRVHHLDGSRLYFERGSGTYAWLEGPAVESDRRRAPRVVQFGLTNRCNLRCGFCYRDRALASEWTADAILTWADALARAGVLELAFGQGEPLLFPGFPALVRALAERTPLAINFTTNGLRLDDARLDELDGAFGQLRLSCYDDNDPLARVRLLARRRASFGVNVLVTPARLPHLQATLEELVAAGCRDVLLLGYCGADPALHLSPAHDRALARIVLDLHARAGPSLALRLSVCFGRRLREVPQLRLSDECGAGDDFVSLDSQRRLSACSFHARAAPVASADELLERWRARRRDREHAGVDGCARAVGLPMIRSSGQASAAARAREPGLTVWRGFASNNSTSYTLVGEFSTVAKSAGYVQRMKELLDRCASVDWASPSPPQTLWQLFGNRGEPPHRTLEAPPRWLERPDVLASVGRRALIHESHVLGPQRLWAHQLLRGYGRILWENDYEPEPLLLLGIDAGEASAAVLAEPQLAHAQDLHAVGGRVYALVYIHQAEYLLPKLAPYLGASALLPVHPSEETLAAAHGARDRVQSRKRRVEWLWIAGLRLEAWERELAELRRDPEACLAAHDFTHPFRMPARLDAFALPGGVLVRSEGAPIPGALQVPLEHMYTRLIASAHVRVRLRVRGDERQRRLARLGPQLIAALSRPGGRFVEDRRGSFIDVIPRDPAGAFAQLRRLADLDPTVHVMPDQPYADALATIDAELDAALG